MNWRLNFENDTRAERGYHRHVTRELDRIAYTFVGMQQDGPASDGLLPAPSWLGEAAFDPAVGFPASLPADPAGFEFAHEHADQRQIPLCVGIVGLELQSPFVIGDGLFVPGPPLMTKSTALIDLGTSRLNFGEESVIDDSLVKAIRLDQQRSADLRCLLM